MGPVPDLPDLLRAAVLAVLALATGYHLVRLLWRPDVVLDGAHALMGGVMLLMLAGWVGRGAGLGWAAVFVAVGVAGAFTRSRFELGTGCAAMVFMLVMAPAVAAAAPATDLPPMARMTGMEGMSGMSGMSGMAHATPAGSSSAGLVAALVAVVLVSGLAAVAVRCLLAARSSPGEPGRAHSSVSIACRVGMNLAAVYMLVLMI